MLPEADHQYVIDGYWFHVAELDEQVMSVVAVRDRNGLYDLFVDDQFARQGIATRLWQQALKPCPDGALATTRRT